MRYLTIFLLLFSLSYGCSSSNDTPSGVAKAYLTALMNGQCEKAKRYATPESEAYVTRACQMIIAMGIKVTDLNILAENELEEGRVRIEYSTVGGPNRVNESSLIAVKTAEGWKVDETARRK